MSGCGGDARRGGRGGHWAPGHLHHGPRQHVSGDARNAQYAPIVDVSNVLGDAHCPGVVGMGVVDGREVMWSPLGHVAWGPSRALVNGLVAVEERRVLHLQGHRKWVSHSRYRCVKKRPQAAPHQSSPDMIHLQCT